MLHAHKAIEGGIASPYCRVENPARRLNVGLVLQSDDSFQESRYELIAAMLSADFVQITHVLRVGAPIGSQDHALDLGASLLMRFYDLVDRKILAATLPEGSESLGSVSKWLAECCWLDLTSSRDGALVPANSGDKLPENLDVLVCAGSPGSIEALSSLAQGGVWWVGPLDQPDPARVAAHRLLATAAAASPMLDAVWALRPGEKQPDILEVGTVRRMSRVSVKRNMAPVRAFGAHLLMAALRRLSLPEVGTPSRDVAIVPVPVKAARGSSLKFAATIALMAARHFAHFLSTRRGVDLWQVGIRETRKDTGAHRDASGYRWVESPTGAFWADPFLFEHGGRSWLFYEHISNPVKKANIACAELMPDGSLGPGQVILDRPYHLSYPQVFESGGEIFMLPETGANQTVELYRAVDFPLRWELVRVLQQGKLYDTTVHQHDGRFWFFSTLSEDGQSAASQLLLFSSDHVDGDWQLHPANPISADARYARSAGSLFSDEGQLIRPSQDCSKTYGGSVEFRAVLTLNEREYREVTAGSLVPAAGLGTQGIHTYNRSTRAEVIDRKRVGMCPGDKGG